jgi:putative MATE family efflux protein
MIRDFMVIWFIGSVFINTPVIGNAAMRAAGDTIAPAVVMVAAALLNALLDPLLIFGLFGFPELGIKGAAISTVFSNILAVAAGYYIIAHRKKMLTRSRHHMRLFGDSAKRFLFIAVPAGITTAIPSLASAVFTALLAKSGHEAVASYGIATRVEAFVFVIIMALAIGMSPIIGQNWGAKQYNRVWHTLRSSFIFVSGWSLAVAVILGLFARPIAGLFSHEAGVIEDAALYFWIVPLSYIPGNILQGWSSAFNAMGMPQRSFLMIFTRLILVNIPLAFIGAHYYGVTGVFAAIAITNITTGIVFHILNMRTLNRKLDTPVAAAAPAA